MPGLKIKVIAALAISFAVVNPLKCNATDYQGGISAFITAIGSSTSPNTFTATSDMTDTQNLGNLAGTNLVIYGNDHYLNGAGTYNGLNILSGETLTINNLQVKNFVGTSSTNTLKNYGTLNINAGTSFLANRNTSSVGGVLYNLGVAVVNGSSSSTVKFLGNYVSSSGGAICNSGSSTSLTVNYADFEYNGYNDYNGTIAATPHTSNGGALFNSNSATVLNSIFANNVSKSGGGAIYNSSSSLNPSLIVSNSVFKNNANSGMANAGAIYNLSSPTASTSNSASVTISKSVFDNNTAYNGGAIESRATTNSTSTASGTANTFLNITSSYFGESVSTGNVVTFSVDTGSLNGYAGGSAIKNDAYTASTTAADTANAIANINTSSFISNVSNASLTSSATGSVTSYGSIMNYSSVGSTVAGSVSNAVLNINASKFDSNIASATISSTSTQYANTFGGAIQNLASLNPTSVSGNISNAITNLVNTDFLSNSASSTVTGSSTATASAEGGAISDYAYQGGSGTPNAILNIINGTFSGNYTSANSVLSGSTSRGGAIYATNSGAALSITGSTFLNNYTTGDALSASSGAGLISYGGAIYLEPGVVATIFNSDFRNNYAATTGDASSTYRQVEGGAILSKGTLNVYNSTFTSNGVRASDSTVQTSYGGAIEVYSGTANIYDSVFTSNKAAFYGGALRFRAGLANIVSCVFDSNSTTMYGGGAIDSIGVSNSGTSYLSISDSIFNSNSSSGWGGAIDAEYSNSLPVIYIANSMFTNNKATAWGGAIYTTSSGAYLNIAADAGITKFSGNTDSSGSNAILAQSGSSIINLNASRSGYILFNDKIEGNTASLYINRTGDGTSSTGYLLSTAPTSGNVIFNEQIKSFNTYLESGMLTLGQYKNSLLTNASNVAQTSNYNYFTNSSLTIDGGILNTANGNIDANGLSTLTVNNTTPALFFDADLASSKNDKFTVTTASGSGTLNIGAINILSDASSASGTMTLFTSAKSPTLSGINAYTNTNKYAVTTDATAGVLDFTKTASSSSGGLYDAVSDASNYKSFSAVGVVSAAGVSLGTLAGSNLTVFGNGFDFSGGSKSGIKTVSGQNLYLYNLGSLNADGTVKSSVNGFNTGSNGGFLSNALGANANISNSVFSNNFANGGTGGAIYNAGSLLITDSTFVGNTSNTGGAIYNDGGAIYIYNSTFGGNTSVLGNTAASTGGAIYNDSGTLYAYNSLFENNTSTAIGGGAVRIGGGTAIFENCNFIGNSAGSYGGGIIAANGTLYIFADGGNSTFSGNNAAISGNDLCAYGGSTYLNAQTGYSITFKSGVAGYSNANTININSTAGSSSLTGGTIAFDCNVSDVTLNIYNGTTKFEGTSSSKVTLADTIFNVYGGTQSFTNTQTTANASGHSRLSVSNSVSSGTSTSTTNIIDSSFTNGTSALSGGIISNISESTATGEADSEIKISGSTSSRTDNTFTSNVSSANGGAIVNSAKSSGNGSSVANANISDATFANNTASSGSGGAIYNVQTSSLGLASAALNISNVLFGGADSSYANSAASGGAIYNKAGTVTIANSNFDYNTAINAGGAIENYNGIMNISNSSFTGNTVTGNGCTGGAIYNYSGSTLSLNDVTFTGNISSGAGGAIYNYGAGVVYVQDSSFNNNSGSNGGAICTNGTVYISAVNSNSIFSNNTTTGSGADLLLSAANGTGTAYLNAAVGKSIIFCDSVAGYTSNNLAIYLNSANGFISDGTTAAPTSGEIDFNSTVSGLTLNIYDGTTKFAGTLGSLKNINNVLTYIYGGTQSYNYNNQAAIQELLYQTT